jgi:hypothetical protein
MIPCKICGEPTPFTGTKLCDACYLVDRQLDWLTKNPQARAYIRQRIKEPVLDDPDDWDYEAILTEHQVAVEWDRLLGYGLSWKQGFMHIGDVPHKNARKAAALFVSLWLRGVSASFADTLMQGFLMYLEASEPRRRDEE